MMLKWARAVHSIGNFVSAVTDGDRYDLESETFQYCFVRTLECLARSLTTFGLYHKHAIPDIR